MAGFGVGPDHVEAPGGFARSGFRVFYVFWFEVLHLGYIGFRVEGLGYFEQLVARSTGSGHMKEVRIEGVRSVLQFAFACGCSKARLDCRSPIDMERYRAAQRGSCATCQNDLLQSTYGFDGGVGD